MKLFVNAIDWAYADDMEVFSHIFVLLSKSKELFLHMSLQIDSGL